MDEVVLPFEWHSFCIAINIGKKEAKVFHDGHIQAIQNRGDLFALHLHYDQVTFDINNPNLLLSAQALTVDDKCPSRSISRQYRQGG